MNSLVRNRRLILQIALFALGCAIVSIWSSRIDARLGNSSWSTGWILLASLILPALFNLRKRLAAFNFGRASTWLTLHIVSGLTAIILYILHAGIVWPTGAYERLILVLFVAVTMTGIIGFFAQLVLPERMAETGQEFVYEKIPGEVYRLRQEAKTAVLAYTEATGSELLSHHYDTSLDWYFAKPRFYWNHVLGGDQARSWVRTQLAAIHRFASPEEAKHVNRIEELAAQKLIVDKHFACQDVLKRWLLLHLPMAAACIIATMWHIVLVHVYAS